MTTSHASRIVLAALALTAACAGTTVRRFPTREPMWRDPDTATFAPRPRKYVSPEVWDTVDNTVFEPLVEVLSVDEVGRARNVNAIDEVPDSSWFENRIDRLAGDPDAIARGACTDPAPDPAGPWTVIGGKPDGANPGFMIQHASGARFLFKLDGGRQGERPSAADVIGSRLYHAAGYNAPCNRVMYLDPATIHLSLTATTEDFVGDTVPFTRAMLDAALARGLRRDDGAIRGGLSQLLDGKPLGPWRDFGTRPDDPNDVIPHEDRRELRGSYVLGAWLGHYDAREQNSLDMWVAPSGDAGYVRHYMLDFGDCLGSLSGWRRVSGRRGHAHELEWPVALVELVTFGALGRPWREPVLGPTGEVLGYFDVDSFTPDHYRTAYRYGPYTRVTEADAAWGARILARISPAAIHAVIGEAQISDPAVAAELERVLLGRRERLLARYLTRLSPLTRPRVDGDRLCVADARHEAGLDGEPGAVTARAITGLAADTPLAVTSGAAGEVCVGALPAAGAAPAYAVIELRAGATRPLWVHLYATATGYRVAGVDRAE